ncbi:uncharacterized protein LOC142574702 [Dermacentor variabilis]|uniref:uncharacterized protein LOC142574702 n=1 Tax=Dermacentor variabilis TaxID=34621 RepID=UPI003F5AF49F
MSEKAAVRENATPKTVTTSLLEGFANVDTRDLIQQNVYVILGHGWYQRIVLVCTSVAITVVLVHSFAYYLIGRPVDHWCQPPDHLRHLGVQGWKNVAIPVLADGSFSKCTVYEPPLPGDDQDERSPVPCKHWDYDTEKDGESIVSMWNLVCTRSWLYSISKSTFGLAPMLFVPIAGIAADRVGRKPVLSTCAISTLLGSLVAAVSPSVGMFILSRLVTAAMASATLLLALTMLYEVTGSQHRAPYILTASGTAMLVTSPLLQLLSTLKPRWVLSQALFVTITAIMVSWCYYLDESPVWQIAAWRLRAAEFNVLRAARMNSIEAHKATATFQALKQQLLKRDANTTSVTTAATSILRSAPLLRRVLSALVTWFSVSFALYASGLGAALEELWALASFLCNGLILTIAFACMKKRGHRLTLSVVLAFLGASSVLQMVLSNLSLRAVLPLPRIMMSSASAIAMCLNYAYTAEVYPTTIRSLGLCLSYSFGRLGVLLATYVEVSLHDEQLLVDGAITTALAFASAIAVQCLPEVYVEKKPAEVIPVLSEDQRKEALKASLRPITESQKSPKAAKPGKQHGPRKTKGEDQDERSAVTCKRWDYGTEKDGENIISMWNLVRTHNWLYTLSKSTFGQALMLCVPIAGITADRMGRRPLSSTCALSTLVGRLVTAAPPSVGMFILSRLVTAAMARATMLMALTMLYEVTGSQHRAPYILTAGGIAVLVTSPVVHLLPTVMPSIMSAKAAAHEEATPKTVSTSLLEGFAHVDTRDLIQQNVYVILGHGRYQRIILVSTSVAVTVVLLQSFAYYLIGRPVDHWCQPPDDLRNLGVQGWKDVAIPVLAGGSFSKCTVYEPPLPMSCSGEDQDERSIVPCNRWDYDTEKDGESIVSIWDLVCTRDWLYSVSKSTFGLAPMLFVPIAGIAADRVGRRPVLSTCAISTLLGSLVAAASSSAGMFILSRLVTAAMASATMLMALTVLYEVTGNEHRATYILAASGIAILVTSPLVQLLSTLKPRWVLSQALLVTVTAIMVSWCYYLDESPVWQIAAWRLRAAEFTVLRVARVNRIEARKATATF